MDTDHQPGRPRPPAAGSSAVLEVDTGTDIDVLLERARECDRVRIRVPSLADGRVFSQVRALLESDDFGGLVEVHGDLLPEQAGLLYRLGVDRVSLENGLDPADCPDVYRSEAYRERRLRSRVGATPEVADEL